MMLIMRDGCFLIDRNFCFRRVQMRFPIRNLTDVRPPFWFGHSAFYFFITLQINFDFVSVFLIQGFPQFYIDRWRNGCRHHTRWWIEAEILGI
jgi:hypothetical protein